MFFETPDELYKDKRGEFYREYFSQVRALPGVHSAAGAMVLPMSNNGIVISFENPEHPVPEGERPNADLTPITPAYFDAMQIPVLEGRDFSDHDDAETEPVMIVNRAFADQFFPGETVIGKKLKPGAGTPHGTPWREIVGVVGNIRMGATQRNLAPAMYLPASQLGNWCCLTTVVRSSVDQHSLAASIQGILSSLDKNIPITEVHSMDEMMFKQLSQPRFAMALLSTFASLALALTIVGLYGVMTYSVSRRTREIGVRMALGAQRASTLRMVLHDAAILLGSGIAIGTIGALASASVFESMLYGTGGRNSRIIASVCCAVAVVGMLAAYLPALRAARVEPMVALRYE
jgi:predicted permease